MMIIGTDNSGKVMLVGNGADATKMPTTFNDVALTIHILTDAQKSAYLALSSGRAGTLFNGAEFTEIPAYVPSAAEVAALAAGQSIDAALAADTTTAQLKAMTNTEFDAWWAANVTTAPQAIQVLKRLAKLAIRRLA